MSSQSSLVHPGDTMVNSWAGASYSDYFKTYLNASLSTGQSYYDPASGLTVRQLQVTADSNAAVVSICRNSSTSETAATCHNGLDDDCDGLIDAADPDCGALLQQPSSQPPPPPPPPACMRACNICIPPYFRYTSTVLRSGTLQK